VKGGFRPKAAKILGLKQNCLLHQPRIHSLTDKELNASLKRAAFCVCVCARARMHVHMCACTLMSVVAHAQS